MYPYSSFFLKETWIGVFLIEQCVLLRFWLVNTGNTSIQLLSFFKKQVSQEDL